MSSRFLQTVPVLAMQESGAEPADTVAPPVSDKLTHEEKERRRNFLSIGWILFIGVGLLGSLLLVMVLVLGASVKRIARTASPPAPLKQEFWYLKPEDTPLPGAEQKGGEES